MSRKRKDKIYDNDWRYSAFRYLSDLVIMHSFSKYELEGVENIPSDGSIIFAPNHCDALMDPFAILTISHEKKVFVARADVFKKPFFKKLLTFFKIMPINRKRDGLRSVLKTEDTIKKSIEVLNNGVQFCILPEGAHRSKHSLLPIGKGIARIAVGAIKEAEEGRPLYIVPVGLEYGDYYRFRSSLLAHIGKPIDVTQYIVENKDRTENEIMQDIRALVGEGMKEQIVYIPDDEDYDGTWEMSKIYSGKIPEGRLKARFAANRKAVAKIQKLKEEQPEEAAKLLEEAAQFARDRREAHISINSTHKKHRLLAVLWSTLKMIVCLPFFAAYAVASMPCWVIAELLTSNTKDKTFCNSLRCTVLIVLWAFLLILWAVVLFCTIPWKWALVATLVLIPAPLAVYDYFELVRIGASDWRYLFNDELKRKYDKLAEEINKYVI